MFYKFNRSVKGLKLNFYLPLPMNTRDICIYILNYKNLIIFLFCLFCIFYGHSVFANIESLRSKSKFRIKPVDTMSLLRNSINNSLARHEVLSANIANANTPRYRSKDFDASKNLINRIYIRIVKTNPRHITSKKNIRDARISFSGGEAKPNGNDVDLAKETAKITKNEDFYAQLLKNYSTSMGLINSAMSVNGN